MYTIDGVCARETKVQKWETHEREKERVKKKIPSAHRAIENKCA